MGTPLPVRFVATSYNIWASTRWPEREKALRAFVRMSQPDILCLQELRPETRTCLDAELPDHQRVEDPFEGWIREGNIYWNTHMFVLQEYGTKEIGMLEPMRRLFWARLQFKGLGRSLLVSTAHYTYQGNQREVDEGFSPRIDQAKASVTALNELADPDEPLLFMGDLNDAVNPIKYLRQSGLNDSFTAFGSPPVPTHPAIPTAFGRTPQVLDWQFHRGPLRVMNTNVVDFYVDDLAPSDHKPVVVTYALE